MRKFIKLLNLKEKNTVSLQAELLKKLQEKFNLRIQLKLGQLKKIHILKKTSRNIASIKHCLSKK